MSNHEFSALGLAPQLLSALDAAQFTTPTPIQSAAIPPLLRGRDLIGLAQTGSGKTAAFVLPLLQNLAEDGWKPGPTQVSALILAPTRELAVQIHEAVMRFGESMKLSSVVILGGVARGPQEKKLARGAHIVVGTPGRILDLISTRHLSLVEITDFVLDEADRMLDLGFSRDIQRIARLLPDERLTAMFSATWPDSVKELAATLLHEPITVEAGERRKKPTPDQIEQRMVYVSDGDDAPKRPEALRRLFENSEISSAIVFTRTKRGANKVAEILERAGVAAAAIHGNKSQNARQRALNAFRAGEARALVATDIAARGIDIPGVTHVINYDMPVCAEDYVHRIGRTARAGADGAAISLCGPEEFSELKSIERLIGRKFDMPDALKGRAVSHPSPLKRPERSRGQASKTRRGRRKRDGAGAPRARTPERV